MPHARGRTCAARPWRCWRRWRACLRGRRVHACATGRACARRWQAWACRSAPSLPASSMLRRRGSPPWRCGACWPFLTCCRLHELAGFLTRRGARGRCQARLTRRCTACAASWTRARARAACRPPSLLRSSACLHAVQHGPPLHQLCILPCMPLLALRYSCSHTCGLLVAAPGERVAEVRVFFRIASSQRCQLLLGCGSMSMTQERAS